MHAHETYDSRVHLYLFSISWAFLAPFQEIWSKRSYHWGRLTPSWSMNQNQEKRSFTQWTEVRAVECDKRFQAQLLESWRRSRAKCGHGPMRFVMTLQLETCKIYEKVPLAQFSAEFAWKISFLQQALKHWSKNDPGLDQGPFVILCLFIAPVVARTNNTQEASERVHRRQVCQSWPPKKVDFDDFFPDSRYEY